MKISKVLFSNIASFPYIKEIHEDMGIAFSVNDIDNIHIFIGPNGAGKSVFLEIIQQLCSTVLFRPYISDIKHLGTPSVGGIEQTIRHVPQRIHNLYKNNTGKDKPSFAFLTFSLNEQDIKNMQFVYDHQVDINALISKYSTDTFRLDYKDIEYLNAYKSILCKFQVDTEASSARLLSQNATPIEQFIYDYCTYFYLIQQCIVVHNTLHPEPENHWRSLHATFAILGSYRNLLHYDDMYEVNVTGYHSLLVQPSHVAEGLPLSVKTSQDHLTGLLYVKRKLAKFLQHHNPLATAFEIEELLQQNRLYSLLQDFCKKYLRRTFVVIPSALNANTYKFLLKDDQGNEYYLDDLSAGEKSMFGIVCTVYGFNLYEGLLIVDEPELHLHPQLQKQFLLLIEEISKQFRLQCIMTTHSSIMINENNIKNVYRFYTQGGVTQIITPGENYNEDASKLMQILKFTNTAKIFFVNKIIMVEGETDEYAFGYYIQHLSKYDAEFAKIAQNYEIVNINGKGGYARWKKFLHTFGIEHYFIGDWDNIQDTGGTHIDMNRYKNMVMRREGKYISKTDKYREIIAYLKRNEPKRRNEIKKVIEGLYGKNVYILQHGDIEAYLGMHEKGLEETVQFFQKDFTDRLRNSKFDEERKELKSIFMRIFSQ